MIYNRPAHLESTQDLVDKKLDMVIAEFLRLHDVVEVSSHEVGDEVAEADR